MRFIDPLTINQQRLLSRLHKHSCFHRVRIRAHCTQLSANGYTTAKLMRIFQVTRGTLYNWFDAWDQDKFAGLYDRKGKYRNPTFSDSQQEQIKQWVKQNPRNLKKVVAKAAVMRVTSSRSRPVRSAGTGGRTMA